MRELTNNDTATGRSIARHETWLTRSWRPLLMLSLMGCVVFAGFLLPLAELLLGHRLRFEPRWDLIPPDLWSLLTIGMSGYIGGRTAEKIMGMISGRS
jgi:hypothetical protein